MPEDFFRIVQRFPVDQLTSECKRVNRCDCNEFITMSAQEVRFYRAHDRRAEASFFMARLTSNVR